MVTCHPNSSTILLTSPFLVSSDTFHMDGTFSFGYDSPEDEIKSELVDKKTNTSAL